MYWIVMRELRDTYSPIAQVIFFFINIKKKSKSYFKFQLVLRKLKKKIHQISVRIHSVLYNQKTCKVEGVGFQGFLASPHYIQEPRGSLLYRGGYQTPRGNPQARRRGNKAGVGVTVLRCVKRPRPFSTCIVVPSRPPTTCTVAMLSPAHLLSHGCNQEL